MPRAPPPHPPLSPYTKEFHHVAIFSKSEQNLNRTPTNLIQFFFQESQSVVQESRFVDPVAIYG